MEAHAADTEGQKDGQYHPEGHGPGGCQHGIEDAADLIGAKAFEGSGGHLEDIGNHPAADGGIEHHEKIVAGHGDIALDMPFGALWLQDVEASGGGFAAGAAYGKFHRHDGHTQDDQKDQVDQDEGCSAVFAGDIRKAPYVAEANGAAG